jgi:uncharacterized membrane protein
MRAGYLDALRGLAVVWMIIFHASYDLSQFGFVSWDFSQGFWFGFPRVIAFTFLFCVGASLNFAHRPKISWQALRKRSLRLGLCALIVSLATYFMFPANWVFFGTLHCILVGSILGTLVVNHRTLSWVLLLSILILQYGLNFDIKWVSHLVQKPSMDFIPIYPWFWPILLGIVLEPYLSKVRQLREFPGHHALNFLGRHSLKIYLIHQPVIFGLLWLLKLFV